MHQTKFDCFQDLPTEIKRMAAFLNKQLTEEQIDQLVDHVRVDKFSKNESVNMAREVKAGLGNEGYTFIRKGQSFIGTLNQKLTHSLLISRRDG